MGLLKSTNKETHANVVDGKLILTCPDALSPIVWQMDLSVASSSALEVQLQDNGQAILALKTTKGKDTTVATFENNEIAVNAMMAASAAMQTAQGQINQVHLAASNASLQAPARHTAEKKGGFFKMLFKVVATLAILFFVYSIMLVITGSRSGAPSTTTSSGLESQSGQPMSADDFLRSQ